MKLLDTSYKVRLHSCYLDIILSFKAVVFVLKEERVVPFKLGEVDAKVKILTSLDRFRHSALGKAQIQVELRRKFCYLPKSLYTYLLNPCVVQCP